MLGQYQFAPETMVQMEYRNLDDEYGEQRWFFNEKDYWDDDITEKDETVRIGMRHQLSKNWGDAGIGALRRVVAVS